MIDATTKIDVQLSEINKHRLEEFTLETVYGRDAIRDQIEADIDEYSVKAFVDGPRTHLGASEIGHECERYLWFKFRWMFREKIDGRKARLFHRGHLEEDNIIKLLRGIGMTVKQVDVDGKQIRIADVGNHFGGSCDGNVALPDRYKLPPHVLLVEFKTAAGKYFIEMSTMGVQKAQPKYYSQMCTYGYKLQLKYGIFIVVNKETDDLWIEIVELDWELGKAEIEKATAVINSYYPPKRISEDGSFWKCKFCPANELCHLNGVPKRNCRSCKYCQPVDNAEWKCHHWNAVVPKERIAAGCDNWEALPH